MLSDGHVLAKELFRTSRRLRSSLTGIKLSTSEYIRLLPRDVLLNDRSQLR